MSSIDEDFIKEEEEFNENIIIRSDTDVELSSITKNLCQKLQETNQKDSSEIDKKEEIFIGGEMPPNSDSNSFSNLNSNSNLNEKAESSNIGISSPELSETYHPHHSPNPLIPQSQYSTPVSLSFQHYDNFDIRPVLITVVKSPLDSPTSQLNKMPPLNSHQNYTKNAKKSRSLQRRKREYEDKEFDAEVKEALERFIKKDQIPEQGIRMDVVSLARRETVDAMLEEDYDRANDLKRAIETITNIMQNDRNTFSDETITNDLKTRLETAKFSQKEIESHYDQIINEQKAEELNRKERLKQNQEEEIQRFREFWQSPEALIPFAKPSVQLLQIRKMQKAFAIGHDFTNAKIMKIKAESLQKLESQEAQKRALNTMKIEYENLLEKHRKETEFEDMNWQRKLGILEMEKKAALKANENLVNQLTLKIEGPKREKRKSVILPIIDRKDVIFTKKIRKRYSDYKKGTENMRLDLKLDSQNILRPKTRAGGKTPRKSNLE